jgi:hypothetical protein
MISPIWVIVVAVVQLEEYSRQREPATGGDQWSPRALISTASGPPARGHRGWHITSPSERKELSLPTITIPRADLTSEEVTRALRAGLGPHYHVVPGMRMPQACLFAAEPDQNPDTILVSIGSSRLSNRFFRAQVTLTRPSGQTVIRIRPGGTSSEFPINALGIARKIRQVLASAPGIR